MLLCLNRDRQVVPSGGVASPEVRESGQQRVTRSRMYRTHRAKRAQTVRTRADRMLGKTISWKQCLPLEMHRVRLQAILALEFRQRVSRLCRCRPSVYHLPYGSVNIGETAEVLYSARGLFVADTRRLQYVDSACDVQGTARQPRRTIQRGLRGPLTAASSAERQACHDNLAYIDTSRRSQRPLRRILSYCLALRVQAHAAPLSGSHMGVVAGSGEGYRAPKER